jgi:hypothetical protein
MCLRARNQGLRPIQGWIRLQLGDDQVREVLGPLPHAT